MADIIDTTADKDLIELQIAVHAAFEALEEWTAQVGKPGIEWTEEERSRGNELREAAKRAGEIKEEALYASGLVEEHRYYQASQALKRAARAAGR